MIPPAPSRPEPLRAYVQHKLTCEINKGVRNVGTGHWAESTTCTCGLDAALASPPGANDVAMWLRNMASTNVLVPSEDVVCEHGVAMDVHCCGCHSGFLFDSRKCICF